MSTVAGLLAVVALIAANGYFVAGEFAFVAARRNHLEQMAAEGDRRAGRALRVVRRLSFMLSGAQLGITVTSLAVGYIAEDAFAAALGPILRPLDLSGTQLSSVSITTGLIVSTGAQMVFGELGPKNLAIAKPEALARALAASTLVWLRVAGPVIRVFDTSANRLLRAIGIQPVEELRVGVSAEELAHIITTSTAEGGLSAQQAGLLRRGLEFRALRVADAMVPRPQVVTIGLDATAEDLRQLTLSGGHSRFPVLGDDGDDVRGVVHTKAVLGVPPERRATTPVRTLLSPAVAVFENAPLPPLLPQFRAQRQSMAVVIDEYGGLAGIVTLEDLVEELVGSIQDEYDPSEPAAGRRPDGSTELPGAWRVEEASDELGTPLPTGDYETLGGLVMQRLGRVPEPGDEVTVGGLRLRVLAMDGRAVERVLATPAAPTDVPDGW